ncbi:MAG: DUF1648 domain-containing protein [bacterium]
MDRIATMLQNLRRLQLLLAVLLVLGVSLLSMRLPASMPLHFNVAGGVDRWTDHRVLAWFGPTLIALGVNALLLLLAELVARYPLLINLPDKSHLRELPANRQAVVGASARIVFVVTGIGVTLLMAIVQLMQILGATDATWASSSPLAMLAVPIVLTVPLLLAVLRVQSVLSEEYRAFRAEQPERGVA